jgi:hypothetical protein
MSTLVTQNISNGTVSTSSANVIRGSARAWVNFDGTGTVSIRASYNVSSITDNGTGDYTVNFTNALPDANYSVVATAISYRSNGGGGDASITVRNTTASDFAGPPDMSTTNVRILSSAGWTVFYDRSYIGVAIFD